MLVTNIKKFFKNKTFSIIFMLLQTLLCATLLYTVYEYKLITYNDSGVSFSVYVETDVESAVENAMLNQSKKFSFIQMQSSIGVDKPYFLVCDIKGDKKPHFGNAPNNQSTENEIVLAQGMVENAKIGDKIDLYGVEFNVVGLVSFGMEMPVNICAMKKMDNLSVNYIANGSVTKANYDSYEDAVMGIWGNFDYQKDFPGKDNIELPTFNVAFIFVLILFCILFFVGTFIMYYYEINNRKPLVKICKICGVKTEKLAVSFLIEFILYGLIQFVVGTLLFVIMYYAFAPNKAISLIAKDYFIVYLIMLAVSISFIYPVVKNTVKKTASEEIKPYD